MIYKKDKLTLDRFDINKIAKKYNTPIYCYSLKKIKNNIQNLKNNFKNIDPLICYAVKANSNLGILKEIKKNNLGADVVSGGELMKALKAGIHTKKLYFLVLEKSLKKLNMQ